MVAKIVEEGPSEVSVKAAYQAASAFLELCKRRYPTADLSTAEGFWRNAGELLPIRQLRASLRNCGWAFDAACQAVFDVACPQIERLLGQMRSRYSSPELDRLAGRLEVLKRLFFDLRTVTDQDHGQIFEDFLQLQSEIDSCIKRIVSSGQRPRSEKNIKRGGDRVRPRSRGPGRYSGRR